MFTVAFATPLPDARSVAGWIDGSDRPSCREAARAPPLCSLSPDLPGRENPAQILVGLVPQWPDVICPYGRLRCAGTFSGDSPKFTGESGTERLVDGDCMEIDARGKWQ